MARRGRPARPAAGDDGGAATFAAQRSLAITSIRQELGALDTDVGSLPELIRAVQWQGLYRLRETTTVLVTDIPRRNRP